jgi:hypothetical protein
MLGGVIEAKRQDGAMRAESSKMMVELAVSLSKAGINIGDLPHGTTVTRASDGTVVARGPDNY